MGGRGVAFEWGSVSNESSVSVGGSISGSEEEWEGELE